MSKSSILCLIFKPKDISTFQKCICSLSTAPLPREFEIVPTDNQSDNQFKIKTFYQSEVLPFHPIKKPNLSVRFWWINSNVKQIYLCNRQALFVIFSSTTFFSYIPRLQNCSHIVCTNSIFVSLSNFERSIARFIVSSLLVLKIM